MSAGDPHQFRVRWLRFDPQRPTRPGLLGLFILAISGLLLICALLTLFTAR